MKKNKTRKLYILLSRFPDNGSKFIHTMTGCYYTHASIGLEEDMNTFYSFVTKGFIVEKITRYLKPGREPFPCQLYELSVSRKVYKAVKDLINMYVGLKSRLRYSKLGLVLSLFRIPYKRRDHYFCSQFVAEILKYSKAARLKKGTELYLPADLRSLPGIRLNFQGNMQSFLKKYGISPQLA